uniref:DUF4371 domain-containing protein n=1 Tax=Amphimedon queenslandica TaxID=400682 RepID=A0A1X7TRH9_AMPQE
MATGSRRAKYDTYLNWKRNYDKQIQTVTWLDCDVTSEAGVKHVTKLKCRVCTKYKDKIAGRKNFSDKWISGAHSVRTTNIVDHAKSDQHLHAMNIPKKEAAKVQGASATSYAPIAQSLSCVSDSEREHLRRKFKIAYFIATEQLSFQKYSKICELETRHGVTLGRFQSFTKDSCFKLVGIATDRAAVNVADGGLKGLVDEELEWIFWMWCLAHRLELAIKDSLKHTSFDLIDKMLLRLYYLYKKSSKKCRELENIINDLKDAFQLNHGQGDGGLRPIRACGTRWVTHKLSVMKRVLSKFGAYAAHLTTLSEDSSVKSADRCKFRGYLRKWTDAKYLLGCALFVDLLTSCSIFSKSMQADELDILAALDLGVVYNHDRQTSTDFAAKRI